MKVKELIEYLKRADENSNIVIRAPFSEYQIKDCYCVTPLAETAAGPAVVLEAIANEKNEDKS